MKKPIQLLICLLLSINLMSQDLVNGDLEGTITGYSTMAPSWEAIDWTDLACEADASGTTPDLTTYSLPGDATNGMIGTAYSGNTFMAGSYGGTASGTFFHEGILQNVDGFTIGENYVVNFYQSVIKTQYCSDTSGSWMVILDDLIIGTADATISQEAYNSVSNLWEIRTISFTATQTSHDLKFLPADDDDNQVATIGDIGGCLYMGIDLISIDLQNNLGIDENKLSNELIIYPNPSGDLITVIINEGFNGGELILFNNSGIKLETKKVMNEDIKFDLSEYPTGVYYIQLINEASVVNKMFLKY